MNTNLDLNNKTILITGSSGFIGFHLAKKLLEMYTNTNIIGLDNMNDYYDTKLKEDRLNILNKYPNYKFIKGDIIDKELIENIFNDNKPDIVVNLAAQAGVRYSIDHPDTYIGSNIVGFYNILDACKRHDVNHFIYASSSSVYGNSSKVPFKENDKTENPESLYAATKICDELLASTYTKLYNIPCTGLRFFTVYGPYGRPDMAYFNFTNKLINKEIIKVFNNGECRRDFTYIDDVVEGLIKVISNTPKDNIYNIGNSSPVELMDLIKLLKEELIRVGLLDDNYDLDKHLEFLPMQKGDVVETYADDSKFKRDYNYAPDTSITDGLKEFCKWYKEYYKIDNKKDNVNYNEYVDTKQITNMILKNNPRVVGLYKPLIHINLDNHDSSEKEIITSLKDNKIKIIIYEPTIEKIMSNDCTVVNDFELFNSLSDIIITDRIDEKIEPLKTKIIKKK